MVRWTHQGAMNERGHGSLSRAHTARAKTGADQQQLGKFLRVPMLHQSGMMSTYVDSLAIAFVESGPRSDGTIASSLGVIGSVGQV
jgi:hypothetical protein